MSLDLRTLNRKQLKDKELKKKGSEEIKNKTQIAFNSPSIISLRYRLALASSMSLMTPAVKYWKPQDVSQI